MGSTSAQQTAANGEHQRAWAVPATTERRPMHARTTVLVALPQPRHAASAVADVVASHAGLCGPVLPIECVRTHASAISTGSLAVFRAFSTPSPAPNSSYAALVASNRTLLTICSFREFLVFMYCNHWRAWLTSCRRLAQWFDTLSRRSQGPVFESSNRRMRGLAAILNLFIHDSMWLVILFIHDSMWLVDSRGRTNGKSPSSSETNS